ncbi:MAG TPA: Ig-like domain-containing protein [Candidatus Dormibacteraeota bacterium]
MSQIVERLGARAAAAMVLCLAAAGALGSVLPVAAAPAISVFVGYADSNRAGGDFPNPWNGAAHVTFDGCSPQSACVFDAGALRVRNDGATTVSIGQVSVHIGACEYVWDGPLYPVSLAPGAALITTQRTSGVTSGCTGPDPATFDSSDIPNVGSCTNDGIQPTVDVTVDGSTTSFTDSGQVLNTGGFDPGACTNTDESTEWVKIGNKPCSGETLSLEPSSQTHTIGSVASVTATLTNSCGDPLADVAVKFRVATGPNAGGAGSGLTDLSGMATFTYSSSVTGTDSLQASVSNAVGFTRTSNLAMVTWIFPFAPGGGSFVVGDKNATTGSSVEFWGAQWAKLNSLTGGPAPRSFKGFADEPATPACGQTWSAEPGNSTPPPDAPLPPLMAVIVTSSSRQIGPEISGDIVAIVLVRTNPGYEGNPGHAGTGTVVAVVCGAVTGFVTGAPASTKRLNAPPALTAPVASGSTGTASPPTCQTTPHGKPRSGRECPPGRRT